MRKWILSLVVLLSLLPSSVLAQDAAALKSFHVRLWSEYDQPSMLVILNFELTDDTQIPSSVEIRIPSDANITAVAYDDGTGNLLIANYQVEPATDANWQVVKLIITERKVYHIEYYQPLARNGNNRSFTYRWAGDYAISDFGMEIELPGDSTGIKTTPAIPFTQNQSFMSGGANLSGLKDGQTYQIKLGYARTSEAISQQPPTEQVEPVVSVDENTDGRSTLNNLPLFLGGFGAALILAALVYFLRGQNSGKDSKPRRRRSSIQEPASQVHCHECGTRAHEGDRFCRVCGSKLRVN